MVLQVAPGFTPLHSFVGGLMLASGVHAMLRELGMVLGISGFFHTNVRNMCFDSESKDQQTSTKQDPQRIHHSISPEDDAIQQSDNANASTSRLFIHGLIAGGALLAASRTPLEIGLGTAIFDAPDIKFQIGKGLSAGILSQQAVQRFVPVALWGLLVGLGTKIGSGCTSGHFLCGLSRFSLRSFAATFSFFSIAVLTNVLTNPVKPITRKVVLAAQTELPSLWAIALMQIPAVMYLFVIPSFVKSKAKKKGVTEDELKIIHEQAGKASSFLIGLHFALGLAMTGMLRPSKVLGFLNLSPDRIQSGHWDPSLAFVALGGIVTSSIGWFTDVKPRVERSKKGSALIEDKPLYWRSSPKWRLPNKQSIDLKLIFGSILFGIGWGVTGLCPGPALVGFGASTLPAPQDSNALVHLANRGIFVGAVGLGGLIAGNFV